MRLKQGIAVFCSVMVLLLSSGMTLHQMTCMHSGHTHLQLSKFDGCCDSPEPVEGLCENGCCEYDEYQFLTSFDFFEEAFEQSFDRSLIALWRPTLSVILNVEPSVQISSGLDPPDDPLVLQSNQSILQVYRI